jgi:hypothetical protein
MFEAASGMERINILSEVLAQNSNITAEAFGKTLAGQIKISDNAFKDMKETIGKAFAPAVKEALTIIQQVSEVFQKLPPELQAGAAAIVVVTAAATALIPVLVALDVELAGIPLIIGAVVAGIGVLYEVLTNMEAIENFITELVGGEDVIIQFKDTVSELWDELKDLWDVVSNELSQAFADVRTEVMDVWRSFVELFGGSENLLNILKAVGREGLTYIKDIILTTIDALSRIIKAISDTIERNDAWDRSTKKTTSALTDLKDFVDASVKGILIMIEVVGRAATILSAFGDVLSGLTKMTLHDLIFAPEQILDPWKSALNKLKDAVSNNNIKVGVEVVPQQGPVLDHPMIDKSNIKDFEKGSGNKTGANTKGSGSEKTSDPYKEENESLKELMANQEHLLKLKDDEIKRGEATLADRNAIVDTYLSELRSMQEGLQNKDNQVKVTEKISELLTAQSEQIKKSGEEQKKLVDDVDKFISKRTEKTLQGAFKETAEIEIAYKTMYDKIDKTSIENSEKEMLRKQLDIKKEEELKLNAKKFDDQLSLDLRMAMLKNTEDAFGLEVYNINEKYNKERKRILDTYTESESRKKLLHQNEIARTKELEKVQTEGEQRVVSLMQSGFESVIGLIQTEFTKMWESVFGEANSLFEAFMKKVLDSLLELVASSFFKLILNTISGGSFGIISSIVGGASGGGGGFDKINLGNVPLSNFDIRNYIPEIPDVSIPSINLPDLPAVPSARSQKNINIGGANISVNSLKLSEKEWIEMVDNDIIPQIKGHLLRTGKAVLDNQ